MWRLRFFFIVIAVLIGSAVNITISYEHYNNFDSSFFSDDYNTESQDPAPPIEFQATNYHTSNNHSHTRAEIDSDEDGLNDDEEIFFGTDPDDRDSDDDGVLDGHEGLDSSKGRQHIINDPDQDGRNNAMDADSDDDGVLDGTECGLTYDDVYGDINYSDHNQGNFVPDADPTTTTDMTNWDTDGDTWSDGDEDRNANGKYEPEQDEKDPNYKDYDDDRLHDDTQDEDDDNDDMPDAFEKLYTNALHPLNETDREEDFDGDGYSNIEEYLGKDKTAGNNDWSDPEDPLSTPLIDTDGDGVDDFDDAFPEDPAASIDNDEDGCPEEWNPGKSKKDSTSIPKLDLDMYPDDPWACLDTDGDGMPNELMGPHPTVTEDSDDDNDAIPDWWEVEYSFNPLNSSDGMSDADGDGFSNVNEYIGDTDPRNPDSYPDISLGGPGDNGSETNEENWMDFIVFLIFVILIAMFIAIIIGYFIIKKRKSEDEFWQGTFGESEVQGIEFDEESRKRYDAWRKRIESEGAIKRAPGYRYRLEIIGGSSESDLDRYGRRDIIGSAHGQRQRRQVSYKRDPRFIGRSCLWCDKGITSKYIKRCPELRPNGRRCPDGPFCSKKCLNEHLQTVPHHKEFIF